MSPDAPLDSARIFLEAALGAPLPSSLSSLVAPSLRFADVVAFGANPVLPFGAPATSACPPRLAVSDEGRCEAWTRALFAAWPDPALPPFLSLARAGTRRMVDSDGGARADVYLDDLRAATSALVPPRPGLALMCAILSLPSGARQIVTRHPTPPTTLLPASARRAIADLVARGAAGTWAVRWRDDEPVGAIWISESRWRGDASATARLVEGLAPPPAWSACREIARRDGFVVYPDALDLRPDGGWDVTVSVVPA